MVKLESFSGLTQKQEDLLSKYYCFGSLAILTIHTTEDKLTFHSRSALRRPETAQPMLSSAWLQYTQGQALIKAKRRTDGLSHYTLEWTPKDLIPNLKAKAECKVTYPHSKTEAEPSATIEYTHKNAKAKVTLADNPTSVKASVTAGAPELGVGVDAKYDFKLGRFSAYNFAMWWNKNSSRLVLKHLGSNKSQYSIGDIQLSYYQRLSSRTTIGTLVSKNWGTRKVSMEVGGEYDYDAKTLLKGKFDSEGKVGLALQRELSPNLKFTVASEVDTKQITASALNEYKLGFRFDFNH
mmetsp:Transcript_6258/g.9285  ORF Transcript_6258/g.9285 Transcript_6258/m.9285 type:complete len:295 (+) Transcript_6258:1391-2275(+)